eukprot:NODE_1106_length_1103_cov_710.200190_g700_i1.p2 GENE.NODE_1106_length_1103_cov_710.200190_g700_i1~~NODE_1106_length_1103_cov_710.200190_g700_i1.p2  ORF type:complete len:330 (-),score=112.90 NODE_1106_length_1103_cov_710.200190_g700_i1:112-1050(-)
MKFLLLAALVVLAAANPWFSFVEQFNRKYVSGEEETHRFKCFMANQDKIAALNKEDAGAQYGVNEFSDMCEEEFAAKFLGVAPVAAKLERNSPVPVGYGTDAAFDWREKGAVQAVKNQRSCGSCWAFSAVGAMEGADFLANGKLLSLSEQELVSCGTTAGYGCQGGWMDRAIKWVISNGGIDSEADYPYTSGGGQTGSCNLAKKKIHVAKFSKLIQPGTNETAYPAYLEKHGPLSIGVDASSWSQYLKGIKTTCSYSRVNHGVLLVGWGSSPSNYWIIKNSWGTSWGESGFIRVQRGNNCCDMTALTSTATV